MEESQTTVNSTFVKETKLFENNQDNAMNSTYVTKSSSIEPSLNKPLIEPTKADTTVILSEINTTYSIVNESALNLSRPAPFNETYNVNPNTSMSSINQKYPGAYTKLEMDDSLGILSSSQMRDFSFEGDCLSISTRNWNCEELTDIPEEDTFEESIVESKFCSGIINVSPKSLTTKIVRVRMSSTPRSLAAVLNTTAQANMSSMVEVTELNLTQELKKNSEIIMKQIRPKARICLMERLESEELGKSANKEYVQDSSCLGTSMIDDQSITFCDATLGESMRETVSNIPASVSKDSFVEKKLKSSDSEKAMDLRSGPPCNVANVPTRLLEQETERTPTESETEIQMQNVLKTDNLLSENKFKPTDLEKSIDLPSVPPCNVANVPKRHLEQETEPMPTESETEIQNQKVLKNDDLLSENVKDRTKDLKEITSCSLSKFRKLNDVDEDVPSNGNSTNSCGTLKATDRSKKGTFQKLSKYIKPGIRKSVALNIPKTSTKPAIAGSQKTATVLKQKSRVSIEKVEILGKSKLPTNTAQSNQQSKWKSSINVKSVVRAEQMTAKESDPKNRITSSTKSSMIPARRARSNSRGPDSYESLSKSTFTGVKSSLDRARSSSGGATPSSARSTANSKGLQPLNASGSRSCSRISDTFNATAKPNLRGAMASVTESRSSSTGLESLTAPTKCNAQSEITSEKLGSRRSLRGNEPLTDCSPKSKGSFPSTSKDSKIDVHCHNKNVLSKASTSSKLPVRSIRNPNHQQIVISASSKMSTVQSRFQSSIKPGAAAVIARKNQQRNAEPTKSKDATSGSAISSLPIHKPSLAGKTTKDKQIVPKPSSSRYMKKK